MNLEVQIEMVEIPLPDKVTVKIADITTELPVSDLTKSQIDAVVRNIEGRLYRKANIPQAVYRSL